MINGEPISLHPLPETITNLQYSNDDPDVLWWCISKISKPQNCNVLPRTTIGTTEAKDLDRNFVSNVCSLSPASDLSDFEFLHHNNENDLTCKILNIIIYYDNIHYTCIHNILSSTRILFVEVLKVIFNDRIGSIYRFKDNGVSRTQNFADYSNVSK
ncbi:hypothetical protein ACI65C_006681 [Semiaphis heraclei]